MRMRLAVIFSLAISLAAQDPEFNVESRLVLVPVTVTDTKGRSIDGLEASDFLIYDNGVRQRAVVDTRAQVLLQSHLLSPCSLRVFLRLR